MEPKSIFMLIMFFASAIIANAQDYMYVRDNDLFVNVRKGTSLQSQIVDTLYNLQIVQVNNEYSANGWMYVEEKYGYVHQSKLYKMPDKYYSILDSIRHNRHYLEYYIASTDFPEILIELYPSEKSIKMRNGWPFNNNHYVFISTESIIVKNMKTGVVYDETGPILPTDIMLYGNGMLFSNQIYKYSLYRNQNGKLCRGLLFLMSFDLPKIDGQELSLVLEWAKNIVDGIKTLEVNNFDYLMKLENAYFNGNEEAKKLYPYVLTHMPLDGDGSHTIEKFVTRFWGFNNRGEIEL